jgi:murein DD-endopeptidase MepM/ murein hydrolase activator NlpD
MAPISPHKVLATLALLIIVFGGSNGHAQYNPNPAPGPYYFVSDSCGDNQCSAAGQFYWRTGAEVGTGEVYGGQSGAAGCSPGPGCSPFVQTVANFNLLATLLGDNPASLISRGQRQVASATFPALGNPVIPPFAFTSLLLGGKQFNLPLGPNLKRVLDDPLSGANFDLTLPFRDTNVALSDHSAVIRGGPDSGVWHIAVDFDHNTNFNNANGQFDVIAAADGTVESISPDSTSVVLLHTASNGQHFHTIYQHLIPGSKPNLSVNAPVARGQKLGQIDLILQSDNVTRYAHLHFALAIDGPAGTVGGTAVPARPYLIDPFGVYDYRRNFGSSTSYNYLPNNRLDVPTHGRIHAYAWRTDPPIGSLLLTEDCVAFNPSNLTIVASGSQFILADGSHSLFSFPSSQQAATARSIIQQYGANQACFIGRPGPSFQYLLVNGRSPVGAATGEDCVSFTPAAIALNVQSNGQVLMVSGSQQMFLFPSMLEAGNALSMIKKYSFTRTCFVGRPDASLQYMRTDGGKAGAFELLPASAAIAVKQRVYLALTWTVPLRSTGTILGRCGCAFATIPKPSCRCFAIR